MEEAIQPTKHMVQHLINKDQERDKNWKISDLKTEASERTGVRYDGKGWLWNITSTGPLARRKTSVTRNPLNNVNR